MELKEKVIKYFEDSKRKRKNHHSIINEIFWPELNQEMISIGIDSDWSMDRKIWHFMNVSNIIPKCSICNLNDAKWQYYKHDYGCCSPSCSGKQSMNTISKKIGVENQFQLKSIKDKSKDTLLRKYGVDNISKLDSIKVRKEETMMKNYGRTNNMGENYEIMSKNMMRIYGVEFPSHMAEFADKMQFNRFKKRHLLITPSGKKIFLQGYEPDGYNFLLNEGYNENDIYHRKIDMPKIMYIFGDKTKRYYPDFFIQKENLIIEIKCNYTYNIEKEKNDAKFLATKKLGFIHRLIIIE